MSGLRVIYVRDSTLPARLIEWFGAGGWSHVATVVGDGTAVIDARSDWVGDIRPGVQPRPIEYLKRFETLWLEVPATDAQIVSCESFLRDQIGKPYDYIGILDFVTGSVKDRNWRDQSAWFCDELKVRGEEIGGICPTVPTPIFKLTPGASLLLDIGLGAKQIASQFP